MYYHYMEVGEVVLFSEVTNVLSLHGTLCLEVVLFSEGRFHCTISLFGIKINIARLLVPTHLCSRPHRS